MGLTSLKPGCGKHSGGGGGLPFVGEDFDLPGIYGFVVMFIMSNIIPDPEFPCYFLGGVTSI